MFIKSLKHMLIATKKMKKDLLFMGCVDLFMTPPMSMTTTSMWVPTMLELLANIFRGV